jgi:hypothetical protein
MAEFIMDVRMHYFQTIKEQRDNPVRKRGCRIKQFRHDVYTSLTLFILATPVNFAQIYCRSNNDHLRRRRVLPLYRLQCSTEYRFLPIRLRSRIMKSVRSFSLIQKPGRIMRKKMVVYFWLSKTTSSHWSHMARNGTTVPSCFRGSAASSSLANGDGDCGI